MSAAKDLFGERFTVHRLLGEGSFGRVYAARDRVLDLDVAVKTISSFAQPEDVYLLKQEFRAACDLVHPHLVRLYELYVAHDHPPHFSMELVRGTSFEETARALRQAGDWSRLERLFLGVAEGLDFLHDHGRVHRDVKPGNVRLRQGTQPVILDFGLTATVAEVGPELVGGSLAYAAPEQLTKGEVSSASDWFSFGVMLFEVITGRLPGPSGTPDFHRAVAEAVRATPSRPLGEILHGTLIAEPTLRLDGRAVRECLSQTSPRDSSPIQVAFVGRVEPLRKLDEAFAQAQLSGPRAVVVQGPSGVGKTTLLRRFIDQLPLGVPILSGRSHPQESLSFRGLDEVVDQLAQDLGGRPELSPRVRADVVEASRIYPGLLRALPEVVTSSPPDGTNRTALRRAAQQALVRLIEAWATARGGVIWLDDVQWADADSGELLKRLLETATAGLLLCCTLRDDELEESRLLSALDYGHRHWSLDRLVLEPFTQDEVADFIRASIVAPSGDELLAQAHQQTGGLPYLLKILVTRHRFRAGRIELQDELEARFRELSAPATLMLRTLALSGRPLPLPVALSAAAIERSEAERGLAELVLSRWARRRGGGSEVELEHHAVREAALRDLSEDARRDCHFSLAQAWLRAPIVKQDALVSHFAGAGREREAVGYALRLADEEARRLQLRRAAELYILAAEMGGSRSLSPWELWARAAEALAVAGQHHAAGETHARAAQALALEAPQAPDIVELRRRAAESYLKGGHVDLGLPLLREVLGQVGVPYPRSENAALATLFWCRMQDRLRPVRPAGEERALPWRARLRIDACYTAGLGLSMSDSIRSAAFQARFARLALDSGDDELRLRALTTRAVYLASEGGRHRRTQSQRLIETLELDVADARDHVDLTHLVAVVAGVSAFFSARFNEAKSRLERAVRRESEISEQMRWETSTAAVFLMWSRIYAGEVEDVQEELSQLVAEARGRGNLAEEAGLSSGLPNLAWLVAGDIETARELSEWSGERVPADNTSQLFFDAVARTQHALFVGDGTGAHALIEELWPALAGGFLLRMQWLRIELWSLRARAAHGAWRAETDPKMRRRLLRLSRRAQRILRREDLEAGPVLARLVALDATALRGADLSSERIVLQEDLRRVGLHLHADGLAPGAKLLHVIAPGIAGTPSSEAASSFPTGDLEPTPSGVGA